MSKNKPKKPYQPRKYWDRKPQTQVIPNKKKRSPRKVKHKKKLGENYE